MIHRILVVLDKVKSVQSALKIACSMASLKKSELIGLYIEDQARFVEISLAEAVLENLTGNPIIERPKDPNVLLKQEEEVEKETVELFNLFQAECALARIEGRFVSKRGRPIELLVERAKTADFLVLSGGERDSHSLYGVEISRIVHSAIQSSGRSILVVPDEPIGESKLVVAYDGSLASERALRSAAEFSVMADFDEVHLLTVDSDLERACALQSTAIEYLSAYDLEVIPKIIAGSPKEVIPDYVDQVDASVIAMGAFGSSAIKDRLFGSTTETLIKVSPCALLLSA